MAAQNEIVNVSESDAQAMAVRPSDPRLAKWLDGYPAEVFDERLYQSIELIERYSTELAVDLAERLNLLEHLKAWHSLDDLCRLLAFQPRFKPALNWILERLVQTGCAEGRADSGIRLYRLCRAPKGTALAGLRAAAARVDPANAATLDLLDFAASLYPAVAKDPQGSDQNLLGPEGVKLWLDYFSNDNRTYAVNNWVGAVLAANRLAGRRTVRILEVGAGAGSATEVLLRISADRGLLPRVERYLVTEPNGFFRRHAQRKLSCQYGNLPLEWAALNLDLPWNVQGIGAAEFDLVYGVNVMHIARNLLFSLNQARLALAAGGWLVIGECLRPYCNQPIYPEFMFQILQSFTDVETDPEIRPNPGFLTAEQWLLAVARAGFIHAEVAPNIERIREIYPHFFTGAICGQTSRTEQ